MNGKRVGIFALFLTVVLLLAGCGEGGSASADKTDSKVSNDPVTVKIAMNPDGGYFTEEEFNRFIVEPVHKRHPNITVQWEKMDPNTNSYEMMVARGDIPDIIIHATPIMSQLKMLGLDYNMDGLIKKHNLDLSRFEPRLIDAVKITSEHDYLIGIPYTTHFSALYYNKDIFDKFGVAYPKDGMTWDETIELAKKLTRKEDGVQYRGLEPDNIARPASQLSIPMIDPKTDTSVINTDQWRRVYTMMKNIYDIPGNSEIQGFTRFIEDKRIAMIATLNYISSTVKTPDLNWDLASYPTFPEAPGLGTGVDAHVMLITSTSKVKDQAFQVIETVVSDEVQLDLSRRGRVSALKDPKLKEQFGQDLPYLKGKNIQSVFKTSPAKPYVPTQYVSIARKEAQNALVAIVKGQKDINTALRDAEEQTNKQIQDAKGK